MLEPAHSTPANTLSGSSPQSQRGETLLDAAVQHAVETIEAPYARIWLVHADGSLVRGAAYGYTHAPIDVRRLPAESVSALTARSGLLYLEDAVAHPSWHINRDFGERTGLRAYLGAALTGAAGPIGVLELMRPAGQVFRPREVSQLQGLARIVSAAVESAREAARLRQALHDSREAARETHADYLRALAVARHELRSYLGRLMLQVEFLLAPDAEDAPSAAGAREETVDRIRRTINGMTGVVEGVLVMTRDDAPGSAVQVGTDISRLIRRLAVDLERDPAAAGRLRVHLPELVSRVAMGETDLERLIANLLDNAVKYSPRGEPIDVTVEPDGAGVAVRVSDHGIGFPTNDQAQFDPFKPFARGTNALARNIPGSGLGLYVCHELVARYAGRIWVDSPDLDGGTTLGVWLPSSA